MEDYAGAWAAVRWRCHRFVYGDGDGHPEHCPGAPVATGWRQDCWGRWFAVDACSRHADQLQRRPGPVTLASGLSASRPR